MGNKSSKKVIDDSDSESHCESTEMYWDKERKEHHCEYCRNKYSKEDDEE